MDTKFLKSNRFWMVVIGAISIYLMEVGVIGEAEFKLIGSIAAGFIGIRTIDRFSEKISK